MTNALESWSWNGCEGKKAVVEVYARAAKVALYLNGKKVGSNLLKDGCDTKFQIRYEPGVLKAVAYDAEENVISEHKLCTAGEETMLRAVPEEKTVKAGKLSFIRLQYTDANGTVKPLERGILQVRVKGGRLLGLGNGCSYNKIGDCKNHTDTYWGEALAVVQADESGPVCLEVSDGKLRASAEIPLERSETIQNKK